MFWVISNIMHSIRLFSTSFTVMWRFGNCIRTCRFNLLTIYLKRIYQIPGTIKNFSETWLEDTVKQLWDYTNLANILLRWGWITSFKTIFLWILIYPKEYIGWNKELGRTLYACNNNLGYLQICKMLLVRLSPARAETLAQDKKPFLRIPVSAPILYIHQQ